MATIPPGHSLAASARKWSRCATSQSPVSKSKQPAAYAAPYSPSECPATTSGRTCSSRLSSASLAARAKSLTWSGIRSPTTRRILGRSSAAGSNTPPPCPGNTNALISRRSLCIPSLCIRLCVAKGCREGVFTTIRDYLIVFQRLLAAHVPIVRRHDAQRTRQHPRPEDARGREDLTVYVRRNLLRQLYLHLPRPRQVHFGVLQERAPERRRYERQYLGPAQLLGEDHVEEPVVQSSLRS